jgi:hypothetical protein
MDIYKDYFKKGIKMQLIKKEETVTKYTLELTKEELIQLAGICGMIGGDDYKRDLFNKIYYLTTKDYGLSQDVERYVEQNIEQPMVMR